MNVLEATKLFKDNGLPEKEALILLAFLTGKSKEYFIAHPEYEVPEKLNEFLELRKKGYPLQYIAKEVEFFKRKFYVEEGVLIPRWETEGLVELAVDIIHKRNIKYVAEIGVGSGVIAVTIALETEALVYGTDINDKAIEVTLKNVEKYNLNDRIIIKKGYYLEPFLDILDRIELIISNPPYVRNSTNLQKEVTFEPSTALFAGEDGLDFYRTFFKKYYLQGKIILMEIGEDQGNYLETLTGGKILKDLSGKDRYLFVGGE